MTTASSPSGQPTGHYDVAVIGAGPVGLALARLLAVRGRSVAVVDPQRVVCQHPRATHLDDETMRTLQTLGAADMEPTFLTSYGWELRTADGTPFLEFHMPEGVTDQGWKADYQFHQPDFESRLRGLLVNDDVALLLGYESTGLTPLASGDGVAVALWDRRADTRSEITASWVVGCDGANSCIRQQIDVDVEDLHGTQRSLIIDVHPFEHPGTLPRQNGFITCENRLPVTYLTIFEPLLRFEFMLDDADDAYAMEDPANVYRLLGRWMAPGSYRIMRTDVYEWHARLVHGWRQGRILIAGDAAHEMPPMLGQGMCSGLRDSANLAWKLDAVLGGADPALLDTYESERAPHVRPYIEESARQANMIEAFADPANRPESGPAQVLVRHRPLLGPGLAEPSADITGPIGQLTPQGSTADGARLDDVVGYRFLVIGEPATLSAASDDARAVWASRGWLVLDETPAELAAWLHAHDADAAIIRPDRYAHAVVTGADALSAATCELADRLSAVRTPA